MFQRPILKILKIEVFNYSTNTTVLVQVCQNQFKPLMNSRVLDTCQDFHPKFSGECDVVRHVLGRACNSEQKYHEVFLELISVADVGLNLVVQTARECATGRQVRVLQHTFFQVHPSGRTHLTGLEKQQIHRRQARGAVVDEISQLLGHVVDADRH